LLRPLPYVGSQSLVQVENRYLPGGSTGWISGPEYWEYREGQTAFATLAALTPEAANLTGTSTPLRLEGLRVTPGFFSMLGVEPVLGRAFTPDEERPGAEPVVLLGDGLWRTAFGADPGVVGRSIELGGTLRTVVGVMGPDYRPVSGYLFSGRAEDFWIPVVLAPESFDARSVERHNLLALGRLAPGTDPESAEALMVQAVRRMERTYPGVSNQGERDLAVTPLRDRVVGDVRPTLLLLTAAVALVLLVACINVASLLLVRGETRASELAVRAALGAGRGQLAWHGLAEGLVLGLAGGAVGVALTIVGRDALLALVPRNAPLPDGVSLGAPVLLFSLGVALAAGLAAGLLPAVRRSHGDVFQTLKSGGLAARRGASRGFLRGGLVVAQVGGAVVLVAGAALLVRSLQGLRSVDPGFRSTDLYTVSVNAAPARYPDPDAVRRLYGMLEERVRGLPRVEAVSASWQTPLQVGMSDWPIMPQTPDEDRWVSADPNMVGPAYFETYGIALIAGRGFEPSDAERPVGPVIVNETAARRLWGDEPAVGKLVNLSFGEPTWREVIGVVSDVRGRGLGQAPRVQTYTTFGEGPFSRTAGLTLSVRGRMSAEALRRELVEVMRSIDPDTPLGPVVSMESTIARSIQRERLLSILLSVFAAVALLLGALGVYGMISYAVSRRTREIGLRIAIGARPVSVLSRVVAGGLRLGALGVGLGLVAALASGRLLEGFLFGVSRTDGVTLAAVSVGVLAVTCVASFLPARRAASVDPLEALRE
jgi:putative ABC transport system permease protein